VTPVRIEASDLYVLVLRGWVAADPRERTRLPEVRTPGGEVVIEGFAQADLAASLELARAPVPGADQRLWQNLALDGFERWSGMRLQRFVVRQAALPAFDDGLVRDWPLAGSDVGKHRAYAFQWYTMAVLTAGGWVFFSFFRRRDEPNESA